MKLTTLSLFLLLFLSGSLPAQQTEKVYLSGTGADNTVEWDFYCSAGMKSGYWTRIPVPSCWEQEGFGSYNYGHDQFEDRLNETGLYRHSFFVPGEWKGKEIAIVFEGVMTDAEVKINGKPAGPVHQGAFYQFKYDISGLLKIGMKNQLEVFVKKHSGNSSVNQAERKADFWVFGGIFRPVFLEVKPKTNIRRVATDARADGSFKANIYLSDTKDVKTVNVEIQTLSGETKTSFEQEVTSDITRIEGKMKNPQTWSPEFPNLYQAVFSLRGKNGQTIHQCTERIGFRTVEVRESDGIYVNGVRVKMKGVDRHTFHPKYGRTSSKALSLTAINLMKDMNMNAVRMSHYPPDTHFLDACDSLGMLVLDELTAWQKPSYDDVVGRKLLEEMIARDVNHPSVILWDNGNEGGENDHLNDDFAELDIQKRKVLHPWQDYDLTNTLHYVDYNYLSHDGFSRRKIFFPTELLHGLYDGGLGAGLDDYWQKMWSDPLCAGGFLWVFADEAIERTDRHGELDTDGNHAPDGILGPYNEKEGSFYTIREVWSPVYFEKKYITPGFDGTFSIQNRYHYTNLDQCTFTAEWLSFSGPDEAVQETSGSMEKLSPDLAPGQNGTLKVKLPANWQQFDALRIKLVDFYGRHINTWSWPLETAASKTQELQVDYSFQKPVVSENDHELAVKTGEVTIFFKKSDGTIVRILKNGQLIPLSNGPVFVSTEKKVRKVIPCFDADRYCIAVIFDNDDSLKWTISGNGRVDLDVAYEPAGSCQFAGITFDFPEENVAGMKWLGNGPYRVYKNRMKGAGFGLWQKRYNRTVTGESGYEYPEFKGYHAGIYWAVVEGKNAPGFTVYVRSNDIFLRMLTPDEPKAPANTKMEYPSGDISFLNGISAIGTKFKQAEKLGPQSAPYQFRPANIHGRKLTLSLSFEF